MWGVSEYYNIKTKLQNNSCSHYQSYTTFLTGKLEAKQAVAKLKETA